jgi:hypothetical protein
VDLAALRYFCELPFFEQDQTWPMLELEREWDFYGICRSSS